MIKVYDEDEYEELEEDEDFFEDEYEELGPDEMDQDLIDGSWERAYYSGQLNRRDWGAVLTGLALLALAAMVIPMFLVLSR